MPSSRRESASHTGLRATLHDSSLHSRSNKHFSSAARRGGTGRAQSLPLMSSASFLRSSMSAFLVGQPMTRPDSSESDGLGITLRAQAEREERQRSSLELQQEREQRRTVEVDVLRGQAARERVSEGGQNVLCQERGGEERRHSRRRPGARCGRCSARESDEATSGSSKEQTHGASRFCSGKGPSVPRSQLTWRML